MIFEICSCYVSPCDVRLDFSMLTHFFIWIDDEIVREDGDEIACEDDINADAME